METTQSQATGYPSDLTDAQWAVIAPLLPVQRTGRPRKYSQRRMLNALLYLLRTGCAWRLLPKDLPPWQAVYAYWRMLERTGALPRINDVLRSHWRTRRGYHPEPSYLVVDSQSVKTTEKGGRAAMTAASA